MTAVRYLFFLSYPATVLLGVITVVVFAIKRHAGWPISHILEKSRKVVAPSITNAYASRPIIFIGHVARIVATLDHRTPCSISAARARAFLVTMFQIPFNGAFAFKTPTAHAYPAPEIIANHSFFLAAFALTPPASFSFFGVRKPNNIPTTINVASKIDEIRHRRFISHGILWSQY